MKRLQEGYQRVTRQETKRFLAKELKKLKEKKLRKLLDEGQLEEARKIADQMKYEGLESFFNDFNNYLFLEMAEIPVYYDLELMFYLHRCQYDDDEIFDGDEEVVKYWEKKARENPRHKYAKGFARFLKQKNINDLTVEDFIV